MLIQVWPITLLTLFFYFFILSLSTNLSYVLNVIIVDKVLLISFYAIC